MLGNRSGTKKKEHVPKKGERKLNCSTKSRKPTPEQSQTYFPVDNAAANWTTATEEQKLSGYQRYDHPNPAYAIYQYVLFHGSSLL